MPLARALRFNSRNFPTGSDGLRRTVARLHAAGIGVGMHCFASKVAKADAHVTPVPDRRFWVDRSDAPAADIGPAEGAIRVAGDLRVPIPRKGLRLQDVEGRDVPMGDGADEATLPVGPRRFTLHATSETAESLRAALGRARFVARARQ